MDSIDPNMKQPRVGVTHLVESIEGLYAQAIKHSARIEIVTSSQPNSSPHMGTVTTFSSAFALARNLRDKYDLPVSVVVDLLDNAPGRYETIQGEQYQWMLKDVLDEGESKYQRYLRLYEDMLERIARISELDYTIRPYSSYALNSEFYRALWLMLREHQLFKSVTNPEGRGLHIRLPCPVCGSLEKDPPLSSIQRLGEDQFSLAVNCPIHGRSQQVLEPAVAAFLDTGTAPREIAKNYQLARQMQSDNSFVIMLDGMDWSGPWAADIGALGSDYLGLRQRDLPRKLYAPTLITADGAKLSKSLYVEGDRYHYLPEYVMNYGLLKNEAREAYVQAVLALATSWVQDPPLFYQPQAVERLLPLIKL
ncbi:hypothetical protein [Pseudomonas sp. COR18]|uniref:hypothetical protein n=1 Tax=Pseudomonas sp. COR18 TaxID=3399680 RepID=UPI003B001D66